jgi:hypothetical protein
MTRTWLEILAEDLVFCVGRNKMNDDRTPAPHGPVDERFMRHHYGASGYVKEINDNTTTDIQGGESGPSGESGDRVGELVPFGPIVEM